MAVLPFRLAYDLPEASSYRHSAGRRAKAGLQELAAAKLTEVDARIADLAVCSHAAQRST